MTNLVAVTALCVGAVVGVSWLALLVIDLVAPTWWK